MLADDEDFGPNCNLSEDDSDNETQLDLGARVIRSAKKGNYDELKKYLDRDANLVDLRDVDGYTPLHVACYNNHMEVVKLLLDVGANVRAETNDGWHPLHCCTYWRHIDVINLLLHNGADINAQTAGKVTPLHLASCYKDRKLLEILLYHPDVDTTLKNGSGETAYDIAYRSGPFYRLFDNV